MYRGGALFLLFLLLLSGSMVVSSNLLAGNIYIGPVSSPDVFDNSTAPGKLADNLMVDSIAIHKAAREMLVFRKGILLKRYVIQLGANPIGPKEAFGDHKTPEGHYLINGRNPKSRFHKSLGISYPNTSDIERALKLGRSPGGDIMIHGLPNGEENVAPTRYRNDWTLGCIAVRNVEIDELFEHIEVGTPLLITP